MLWAFEASVANRQQGQDDTIGQACCNASLAAFLLVHIVVLFVFITQYDNYTTGYWRNELLLPVSSMADNSVFFFL